MVYYGLLIFTLDSACSASQEETKTAKSEGNVEAKSSKARATVWQDMNGWWV